MLTLGSEGVECSGQLLFYLAHLLFPLFITELFCLGTVLSLAPDSQGEHMIHEQPVCRTQYVSLDFC